MNDFRVTSHAEMIQDTSLHNRHCDKGLQTPYEMDGVDREVINGVVLKRGTVRTFNPVENMRGYNATDFAMENIVAAGALSALRQCSLHYSTAGEISDGLEGTIDNLISAVDAAEQNNATNTQE